MLDTQIIKYLIDEFGEVDTLIFCDVFSRYYDLLSENKLDENSYCSKFFKGKSEEIKQAIYARNNEENS